MTIAENSSIESKSDENSIDENLKVKAPLLQSNSPDTSVPADQQKAASVPVRRTPMSLSRRFFHICTSAAAEALAADGLTPLESGVLAYLSREQGEPNLDQSELAARMGVDRSHVSLLVDRLADRGLVDRKPNPQNRRANILSLTPHGEEVHARNRPRFFEGQQKILAVLSAEERELFLNLLVRVVLGNSALDRPGAGRRKRGAPKT